MACWGLNLFFISLECFHYVLAYPIPHLGSEERTTEESEWSGQEYLGAALAVAALFSSVTTLLACVCCKRSGFKELGSVSSRVAGSTSTINNVGGGPPREEFTMFPPAGISTLSLSTNNINFEPLPDIRPRSASRRDQKITDKTLPASFPSQVSSGLPTDEWFAEPHQNFPRNQLQYVKEIGKGWFGHVLEGRATGIFSDHTKGDSPVTSSLTPNGGSSRGQTPVAVKVLREDATPTEQMYFLHELRPYRDLSHPNVLKVLAQCLETEPFLILLQLCPKGDLKAVVRNDKNITNVMLLRMTLDVAAGLSHMHSNFFIHTDLAARNCVVDEDYTVKIGDYGYNIDFYKNEYYCAGEVALPLRWCAPETLKCTDTTIETKEVTKAANVWSFGVIMWEIASRGLMPYTNLDDDRVIHEVVIEQSTILEPPKALQLHAQKIYNIMKLCWCEEPVRPPIEHITLLLSHLWEHNSVSTLNTSTSSDFEQRWDHLQQRQPQDHSIIHGVNTSDLRFDSDFSLSVPSGGHMAGALSPSLQNLRGSVEDLDAKMAAKFGSAMPSWLGMEPGQPMDSLTREITDAILKLDDYLAGEKSEPSSTLTSPEKDGVVNFKVGKDSFVSHPPESKLVHVSKLSMSGSGHPSLSRTLSDGEEEGFTMRLEQGEFSEMVRLKSQSVQDFMKLTVVDDGSDSDNASQRNSLAFEQVNKPLASSEKNYSSEGNISEALRDVRFMTDLERMQAEHKYSIITEASRENPSSIEFRAQDFYLDNKSLEAECHDKLTASEEDSDSLNQLADKQNSEHDPFLGEIISSEITEEKELKVNDLVSKSDDHDISNNSINNSSVHKPLSACPDFVVSSREKKPVSLPDIVVHDSAVKLATPSPPPDTPLKVVNMTQPEEFRLVFSNESITQDTNKIISEKDTDNPSESVIFSENIRDNDKFNPSVNEKIDDEIVKEENPAVVRKEESSCKKEEIIKFLDFVHENPKHQLTSTPMKRDSSSDSSPVLLESDEDRMLGESSSESEDSSSVISNCEDEDYSGVVAADPDNSGVKHRLVFGYQSDRDHRKSSISSSSSSSDSSSSSSGSNSSSSSDNEEEGDDYKSEAEDQEPPSYKPEQIVEGEEVVIGALDDYSLDLFKAVKSNSEPLSEGKNSSNNNFLREIPETDKIIVNSQAENIEYDLDQWDKFLGNKLTEEKLESDVEFKVSPNIGANIKSDSSSDILGGTFYTNQSINKDAPIANLDSQLRDNCNEKSGADLSSTFEHSTCDEINNILLNEENAELSGNISRPNLNTDLFFSSDSSLSVSINDENLKGNSRSDSLEVDDIIGDVKSSSDNVTSFEFKHTDASFSTAAESVSITLDMVTKDTYESVIKSSKDKLNFAPELIDGKSSSSPTVMNSSEQSSSANCSNNETNRTVGSQAFDSVSCIDITSDSFTYKKEESVDNMREVKVINSTFNLETSTTNSGLNSPKHHIERDGVDLVHEDVDLSRGKLNECDVSSKSIEVSAKNLNDSKTCENIEAPKDKTINVEIMSESFAISDNSKKSAKIPSHENVLNEGSSETSNIPEIISTESSKTSNMMNFENSRLLESKTSSVINLKSFEPQSEANLIIGEDDDMSPSAYQGKLKREDCWSSQESQDSAVENDEAENGDFWQQQMMAWQQAAFQTRQLLQQAAGSGSDAALGSLKGSQEDLDASPRSDTSSTKSPYSSTDMLNLDDEGTYVSYNTTDDEEVLGYKAEDINALRAELSLKLGGIQDDRNHLEPNEPEDDSALVDRENVVINYRGIVTTTLSPIKEESFLDEDESPVRKNLSKCNSSNKFDILPSLDLDESLKKESIEEIENGIGVFDVNEAVNDFVVNNKVVSLSEFAFSEDQEETSESYLTDKRAPILDATFVSEKETSPLSSSKAITDTKQEESLDNNQNSLILEDLEDEDGPSSIQIYNSDNLSGDDVLVVDTLTNEATIVEGGIPRSHLAFITDEQLPDPTDVEPFVYDESDDVAPESIPSVGGSRFDEMKYREQFLTNNPSLENQPPNQSPEYEGDLESKLENTDTANGVTNGMVTSEDNLDRRKDIELVVESPQGIQVPHYHSYFTSALSSISHPSASLEDPPMFEPVEHISLPYDVNYPTAGEHLLSLEDVSEKDENDKNKDTDRTSHEATNEECSDPPIKLNFLGRLYSDDPEETKSEHLPKSQRIGEATLLSDSEGETDVQKLVDRPKTPEPSEINQMTSAEFLASGKYQINETDDVEEHIVVEPGYEEDSEDDGVAVTPGKLANVEFRMNRDPRYTPDWESDSDSDGESSSTSGEFMWRPGEDCHQSSFVLDVIEEEAEDEETRDGDVDGDGCSDDSESGEEEFTPSKWNRDLTPSHSLLKSPQNRSSLKKSVRWKRQRHHRVYEYPPEPRSWDPTPTESHQRRSWGRSSLDYLSLADWDLGTDEFIVEDSGDMDDYVYSKPIRPAPPPPIYSLGSISFDDATEGYMIDNGEFFIRSSGAPFAFTSSSFSASDFFPGNTVYGDQDSNTLSDQITDKVSEDLPEDRVISQDNCTSDPMQINKYIVTDDGEQSSPNDSVGQLRHTRDKLRLEIPTISVASDITKGAAAAFTLSNEQGNDYTKYNGQDILPPSVNLTRAEPEVSEV